MHSLSNSEILKYVKVVIEKNTDLFMNFKEVYIFGSVVSGGKSPNDIDLLLIYDKYNTNILNEIETIRLQIEGKINILVDVTALSKIEIDETCFLSRLQYKYIKVK